MKDSEFEGVALGLESTTAEVRPRPPVLAGLAVNTEYKTECKQPLELCIDAIKRKVQIELQR